MADIRISELPDAPNSISGAEFVPIVQNGQTVKTTVANVVNSPVLTQSFITANSEPSLPNERTIGGGLGVGTTNTGTQLLIGLNGVSASLENASNGLVVKNSSTTVTNRSIAISGNGLSVTNGSGVGGNPTIALTGLPSSLAGLSGTGLLATDGTNVSTTFVSGTNNQITVATGTTAPVISIANNPIINGTGSMTIPSGTTAQRSGTAGAIRYNTDTGKFEVYGSGGWDTLPTGGFLSSFSAGSTGFTPSTATTGAVTLAGTLNPSNGGTGATTLTGYVYGNGTGAMTASTTIPNAGLANSSITLGTTNVALGATVNTLADMATIGVGTLNATTVNGAVVGSGAGLTNIPNSALVNSSVTIGSTNIPLGGTTGTIAGLTSVTATTVYGNLVGGLSSATGLPLTTGVTGVLPIANGGTNSTATPTAGGVGYGTGTAHAYTSAGTAGNFLQSNGAGVPVWSAISTSASTIGISTNSTNATYYPTYYTAQSGTATTEYTNPNYTFNPSTGTLSATSFIENGSNIVSQKDVGTNANQIPLNQYLGTLAYQDAKAPTLGLASINNIANGLTSTVTSATTVVLTANSALFQRFTGSTAQTVKLPDETTLPAGVAFVVDNDSSQNLTLQDSSGATLSTIPAGMAGYLYNEANTASTGNWSGYMYVPGYGASGAITWGTAGLTMGGSYITGVSLLGTSAVAPTIASATTIAPTKAITFISGTTAIATITPPVPISTTGGQITLIPTGIFTTTTAGNIALASTAVVSKALIMTYDSGTTKWYPSY